MTHVSIPLAFERLEIAESRRRSRSFLELMKTRRTVRDFAPDGVPQDVIDTAIATASSAPSGANKQPWRFVVVRDLGVKRAIREAAEAEEREFYEGRVTAEWREDLAALGTDWHKPFLEIAPCLIVVFAVQYDLETLSDGGQRTHKNYYVQESVGIALGFLIAALHVAGLATLTHTPSPMGFLGTILGRPKNERPFVLLPVGYPAAGAQVPDIAKKSLDQVRLIV